MRVSVYPLVHLSSAYNSPAVEAGTLSRPPRWVAETQYFSHHPFLRAHLQGMDQWWSNWDLNWQSDKGCQHCQQLNPRHCPHLLISFSAWKPAVYFSISISASCLQGEVPSQTVPLFSVPDSLLLTNQNTPCPSPAVAQTPLLQRSLANPKPNLVPLSPYSIFCLLPGVRVNHVHALLC